MRLGYSTDRDANLDERRLEYMPTCRCNLLQVAWNFRQSLDLPRLAHNTGGNRVACHLLFESHIAR